MHAAVLIPLSRQNTSPINSQRFGSIPVGSRLHDEKVLGIPANNNKARDRGVFFRHRRLSELSAGKRRSTHGAWGWKENGFSQFFCFPKHRERRYGRCRFPPAYRMALISGSKQARLIGPTWRCHFFPGKRQDDSWAPATVKCSNVCQYQLCGGGDGGWV
jgi:hypothetical protein